MKLIKQNVLIVLSVVLSITAFGQINILGSSNNGCFNSCNSNYSATLELGNIVLQNETVNGKTPAAPLFNLKIAPFRSRAVSYSSLKFSFRIKNFSKNQLVDFEGFNYANENYNTSNFNISLNDCGWYDVVYCDSNNEGQDILRVDDRAGVNIQIISNDRWNALYRAADPRAYGYHLEIKNVSFSSSIGCDVQNITHFENCASNTTETLIIYPEIAKTGSFLNSNSRIANMDGGDFEHITVYPNPVKDKIFIQLNEADAKYDNLYASIFNKQGKLLSRNLIKGPNSIIPADDLSRGFYVLKLSSNNEFIAMNKILIAK